MQAGTALGSMASAPSAPPSAPTPTPPAQGLDLGSAATQGSAWQNGAPIAQGFDNSLPAVAPSGNQPGVASAAPPPGPVPVPPQFGPNVATGPAAPAGSPFLPPNSTPTVGATSALAPASPPLPPPSLFTPEAAPPTALSGGGLSGALGLNNSSNLRVALAGLGRGLSAVGAQRPGTNGVASFAGGMGGALTGSEAARNAQEQQQRQLKNDLFNQSSSAFKDMLASRNADNVEGYRQAQAQYLRARAGSLLAGGTGSGAWQATPYGKVIQIENEAQKYEKGQQIILQKRWQLNGASATQQQEDLDKLQKNVETYRGRLYKQAGIDPNKAAKLKDMGTSQDNPFDTKGMTLEQFHDQVPMGAWYKDQNGVVRQRTVPPPSAAPAPGAGAANYDDMTAMQPAA
jgi:hypothetical protein